MLIGVDFHSAEREGSGNCSYIRSLVEEMTSTDDSNEYFLYVTDINHPYYEIFRNRGNVHLHAIPFRNPFLRIPLLGIKTFGDNIDVLHVQYIAPPFYKGKLVVMIHDLAFLHFPECFKWFEKFRSKLLVPWNAGRAKLVLTGSGYSKDDLIKHLCIPEEKVNVIYHGLDKRFNRDYSGNDIKNIQKKYGITGKYILSVGRLDPRKNLPRLIEAFKSIKKENKLEHKLVIIGKDDYMSGMIGDAVRGLENEIIKTGYVSNEDLPYLYNGAEVFVYPTLFEGFGLPVLEAMACGCPVVTSNVSSIPEVAGDACMLIDPFNTDELCNAIKRVLFEGQLRKSMIEKGICQAGKFDWKNTADTTKAAYRKALQ